MAWTAEERTDGNEREHYTDRDAGCREEHGGRGIGEASGHALCGLRPADSGDLWETSA